MHDVASPPEYLVISRGQWDEGLEPSVIQAAIDRFYAWHAELVAEGKMVAGQRLAPERKLVSKSGITDGPFTETKEVIGGYWFIRAATLAEAAKIAADNPCIACGLSFEIRPIEPCKASAYDVTTETPTRAG
ncbi:MAG: hypothetical protein C0483_03885 [Pirellula sp.]|nr:hypothetical protein [Pirellula sp.]